MQFAMENSFPCIKVEPQAWLQRHDSSSSDGFNRVSSGGTEMHDSPSPDNCLGEVELTPQEKKLRHKLVERNRRNRTRKLTMELQNICPQLQGTAPGTNINIVLQGVLEYLQSEDFAAAKRKGWNSNKVTQRQSEELVLLAKRKAEVPRPFVGGMYSSAFDLAPMGMIMAALNGNVVRCNSIFFELFGLDTHEKPTMFSLTHQESMPDTMQAAASLISGRTDFVCLSKKCIKKGGLVDEFQVRMSVVKRDNKPAFLLCYVKLYNPKKSLDAPVPPSVSTAGPYYAQNHKRFVREQRFFNLEDEDHVSHDQELNQLFVESQQALKVVS